MQLPFMTELFVLARNGVESQVDKIPGSGEVKAKGTICLSNIRLVFVACKPVGSFFAFHMPLVSYKILRYKVVINKLCVIYIDPNDPTGIFLQQPNPESQLRRRAYHSHPDPVEHSIQF
ncbi:gram domain-containing protein [Citrus sinensis]|nr:gram domain-containing protein [Citrus sinensis]